jgi:DNA polymerase-1
MSEQPDFTKQLDCVYVFDVAAFLHRAMHALHRDQVDKIPADDTTAAHHALSMISSLMSQFAIRRMVVCPDSTERSLRCDYFSAYKAERRAHPPVFRENYPKMLRALERSGVRVIGATRYEADDVIATLVTGARDFSVVIVSSDKDLWQLILDGEVAVYDPMQRAWRTRADCKEKFGVEPGQICDYIGLVGDTSDGIPGVPGIGAKTAANLLRDFGDLDAVYDEGRLLALSECVSKKQLANLLAHREFAFLSRRLAQPVLWKGCPALSTEERIEAPVSLDPSSWWDS